MSRTGLRARLMAIFALLSVTPTLLLGLLAVRSARRNVEQQVVQGNLALIRAVGGALNATLQDSRRALVVAAAAWAQNPGASSGQRILRSLRSEFAILRSATLLDISGKQVCGDPPGGRDTFPRELANTYGGYVSEVLFQGSDRLVTMVVQARDRNGALTGFLAATVDLGFVRQRLSEARLGPEGALLLVDGNGRKVAHRGALPRVAWGHAGRAKNPALDRVLASHTEGYLELTDGAGRRWLATYRNISGMNEFRGVRWGVMFLQPVEQAYALARRTIRATLAVTLAVLLIALGVGAWLARRITRPLALLARQTELVADENYEQVLCQQVLDVAPGTDEIGTLARSFATMIRRLRRGRDRLYALTEFRENLVRAIPVGVISVDSAGLVRSINPAQERLSQVRAEQVQGRPLWQAFPADGRDPCGVMELLRDALVRGEAVDETLDDRATPFTPAALLRYHIRMAPLRDREGAIDGAVVLQEDLSRRARLEMQLLRSEKLSSVGVLAAGVAHEINNPLTTILGYALLLLEGRGEDDPDHAALTLVAEEARRVQEIVRNLLDFSRQDQSQVVPTPLNPMVERTLSLAAPDLRKRGIAVEQQLSPGLPAVHADPRQTEQVLVNLITNAAHAMSGGGRLLVRTGSAPERPGAICAELRDSGPGIPPEVIGNIFDPFFTTKEPGEGTGLGLAISQRIVADQGGQLEVESPLGPDGGTLFRVWFTVASEEAEG